jgi:hypothetical protein
LGPGGHNDNENQVLFDTVRIRILIHIKQLDVDPYQIEKKDPDLNPYQSEKQDPDPYQKGLDPQHCIYKGWKCLLRNIKNNILVLYGPGWGSAVFSSRVYKRYVMKALPSTEGPLST